MKLGAPMILMPACVYREFMTTSNLKTPTLTTPFINSTTNNNNSTNSTTDKSSSLYTPPAFILTPSPTQTPTLTSALSNSHTSSITLAPAKELKSLLNGKILDEDSKGKDSEEKENQNKHNNSNNGIKENGIGMNVEEDSIEKSQVNNSINGEGDKLKEKKLLDKLKEKLDKETKTAKNKETDDRNYLVTNVLNGNAGSGVKRTSDQTLQSDLKKIRVSPLSSGEAYKQKMRLREINSEDAPQNLNTSTTTATNFPIEPEPQPSKERPFVGRELNLKINTSRLTRKELENVIMRQFSEKLLYEWEIGRMKQMCEKLETVLENNRKKTTQLHKEVEDLRKVTKRLSDEHLCRKGDYVTPIRIKRSVGIQAAPQIINKGLMCANSNNNTIKTITPRRPTSSKVPATSMVGVMNSTNNESIQPPNNLGIINTVGTSIHSGPGMSSVGSLGPGVRSAQGHIMMMDPANNTPQNFTTSNSRLPHPGMSGGVVPVSQGPVVRAPMATVGTMMAPGSLKQCPILHQILQGDKAGLHSATAVPKNSGVIDLTDEDDVSHGRTTTALNPSIPIRVRAPVVKVPASGTPQLLPIQSGCGHPAPLPQTPVQQVAAGISKMLPPQPSLKLTHKASSIVLSWTIPNTQNHDTITSYELYAYQESSPPSSTLWKKVGSVKALQLPMACTLTQCSPGHIYHFAVRAVDIKSRLGPFSDPKCIKHKK